MARFLYINPDETKQSRATTLGCGWMPTVPPEFALVATAPCVILSGAGTTTVLPEPTTRAAVNAAAAPILSAEQASRDAQETRQANRDQILSRLDAALTINDTFLALGATPTAAQVRDQVIVSTKELSGLIRVIRDMVNTTSGT